MDREDADQTHEYVIAEIEPDPQEVGTNHLVLVCDTCSHTSRVSAPTEREERVRATETRLHRALVARQTPIERVRTSAARERVLSSATAPNVGSGGVKSRSNGD